MSFKTILVLWCLSQIFILQKVQYLVQTRYEQFPVGDPYRLLLQLVEEERLFWSELKSCYKQKREELKAKDVGINLTNFSFIGKNLFHSDIS